MRDLSARKINAAGEVETIDPDDEDRIAAYITTSERYDLPLAVKELGYSWEAVLERLKERESLHNKLFTAYQRLKYRLIQRVSDGIKKREQITISNVKFLIELIDSGALLLPSPPPPEEKEEEGDAGEIEEPAPSPSSESPFAL